MSRKNITKNVTRQQLTQILLEKSIKSGIASFAKMTIFTDARLRKTGNPYPNVRKLTEMTVLLNTAYEAGVHNQLKREGKEPETYVPGRNYMPLEFGPNNKFVGFFKGEAAIQFRPFEKSNPKVAYFTEEGIQVAYKDIEPFMPKKKERDPEDNRQGTEKEIMWRKTYVENVIEMTVDHVTYRVIN